MSTLNLDETMPRRLSGDISERQLDGEAILWDPVRRNISMLNETASFILNCCDGTSTVATAARRLMEEFEIDDMSQALRDISACLSELQKAGLLESETNPQ